MQPDDSETISHLRYARAWGVVTLLAACLFGLGASGALPSDVHPMLLRSVALGAAIPGGFLAARRGWKARSREGKAWFAIGLAGCLAAVIALLLGRALAGR